MSVIVRDSGFAPEDMAEADRLVLAPDTDPADLASMWRGRSLIIIDFPSHTDGRGLTLARLLRHLGYRGRLRARGQVLPDQYRLARRAGFDEVEIDDARAARQPERQWIAALRAQPHDYRGPPCGNLWPSTRAPDRL